MKYLVLFIFLAGFLEAKVYYSKVEPYDFRYISSNVNGVVTYIDEDMLGKKLSAKAYIKIDADLDKKELKYLKLKSKELRKIVEVNEAILINLQESLKRKRINYKQIENLKIKSRVEKDREFYDLVASENSSLATQKEINNLKVQLDDLAFKKAQLERNISDKYISNRGFVLYSIEVKRGQVVNKGTLLAKIADTSKALLSIYLDEEDLKDAKKKILYIDGKKTAYKITRLSYIADAQNISKYLAQIVIKAPKVFSKLAKIELKDANDAK